MSWKTKGEIDSERSNPSGCKNPKRLFPGRHALAIATRYNNDATYFGNECVGDAQIYKITREYSSSNV